ncbi:hypothetical protein [Longispora albida]|uniref:hypothetical protein n=1 Tax=Longispora albida TaxID=203523 RepID=UPI0012F98083|nr:hypothetical protein [Longispora albida]
MSIDLVSLGWGADLAAAYRPHHRRGQRPGRVLRADQGVYTIFTATGTSRATLGGGMLARGARSPQALPCVGDWVVLRTWPDGPVTIETVLPRRSAWRWPSASRTLAANLDAVLLANPADWHPEDIPALTAAPPGPLTPGFTLGLLGVGTAQFTDIQPLADEGLIVLPHGGAVLEIQQPEPPPGGGPDTGSVPRQLPRRKMSDATDTVADWRSTRR